MTVSLFDYPQQPHVRKHGPSGYRNYKEYKPWLRDEFAFRCVYCLEREVWYPNGADAFSADHVVPQSEDPSRICDYTNLIYACMRCNSCRGKIRSLDPTLEALGEHLALGEDGHVVGQTDGGKMLIKLLLLNEGKALRTRRKYLKRLKAYRKYADKPEIKEMYYRDFGFPEDMDDLRLKRPAGGNIMKDSEQNCCFALRERGELPRVY